MSTQKFWKFAEEITNQETLTSVFDKFASQEKLTSFGKQYLWTANND